MLTLGHGHKVPFTRLEITGACLLKRSIRTFFKNGDAKLILSVLYKGDIPKFLRSDFIDSGLYLK